MPSMLKRGLWARSREMSPRVCTAKVAAFTALSVTILSVGFYHSLKIRSQANRYFEGVEEEIRRLDGQNSTREAVLRDTLLESLYFGEKTGRWYDLTLLLAVPLSIFSFLLCRYHEGARWHKVFSWTMWSLGALLLALFTIHNLIL